MAAGIFSHAGWTTEQLYVQQVFERAVLAFRSDQLESAKALFIEAEKAGLSGQKLDYNLGVVNYRLGSYREAQRYFRRAVKYSETQQIVQYNLGRCAQALGQHEEAVHHYRHAQYGKDARVSELARKAEIRLKHLFLANFGVNAELSVGFDSSVVGLIDQVSDEALGVADLYQETRLDVAYKQHPASEGELGFQLNAYQLAYEDVDEVNLQSLRASLNWHDGLPDGGRWGWRLQYGQEWLASDSYQIRGGLRGRYEHGWESVWVIYGLEAEWYESQQHRLSGIDGMRYQASTSLLGRIWSGHALLRVGVQLNERREDFNSPQRVSLMALWRSRSSEGLVLQPSIQWRESSYSGHALPKERRWRAQLRVSSHLSPRWQSIVDLEYESNDSVQVSRQYEHLRVSLGLRWARD